MKRWRVPLPRGAEPPYRVFVNGVPQREGDDYEVAPGELRFFRPLAKERLGLGRWTAIFLGLFGSYGKNDSVDVQYRLGGRNAVATGLEIIPPSGGCRPAAAEESPQRHRCVRRRRSGESCPPGRDWAG